MVDENVNFKNYYVTNSIYKTEIALKAINRQQYPILNILTSKLHKLRLVKRQKEDTQNVLPHQERSEKNWFMPDQTDQ